MTEGEERMLIIGTFLGARSPGFESEGLKSSALDVLDDAVELDGFPKDVAQLIREERYILASDRLAALGTDEQLGQPQE